MPTCVKFAFANKIEAMYGRSHVSIKVESRSTSRLYFTFILFTWLKFTCANVHSQKRVSGNQPLSTVSKHLLLGFPLKIYVEQNKYSYNSWIPRGLVVQAMDSGVSTSGFEARLCHLILNYLESNAAILHNFWRPQPTLPCFGLQYSISKKPRTMVSLSSMQGVFAESVAS